MNNLQIIMGGVQSRAGRWEVFWVGVSLVQAALYADWLRQAWEAMNDNGNQN